jgi:hypothetical protein
VISNADILWTESLRFVRLLSDDGDEVFALSRHDMVPDYPLSNEGCPHGTVMTRNQCHDYGGSHDGFAFRVPLRIHEVRKSVQLTAANWLPIQSVQTRACSFFLRTRLHIPRCGACIALFLRSLPFPPFLSCLTLIPPAFLLLFSKFAHRKLALCFRNACQVSRYLWAFGVSNPHS